MGRVKKCRMCDEVLVCQKCGTQQTPESPDTTKFTMLLTEAQRKNIERDAKKRGMTKAAYIRDVLGVGKES